MTRPRKLNLEGGPMKQIIKSVELFHLIKRLKAEPLTSLDEIIHDLKDREASSINNKGIDDQIAYIIESVGESEAVTLISNILG